MRAVLVTHTHWDREWYRTFQAFRARLVDAVDRVLDLCAADPGYRFLLDGQSIVLEDYLEIRPARARELRARCAEGRIAVGPWYVQPDSLLPGGEAHVRNLLLGRQVALALGGVEASRVGYTPDSFGHPAQFPQLLRGFGIDSFVYWRGHGDEIDSLPAEFRWEAPDGSSVLACHLGKGYFNAATPPGVELPAAGRHLAGVAKELAAKSRCGVVLLLNGIDHAPPEPRTADLAREIAAAGGFPVERGLLEDYVSAARAAADAEEPPRYRGELVGARVSPLLPGVWSTRTWIKLRNRRCETALTGWAEPVAAIASSYGLPDERPALRLAWRALLANQAHDSLCGCSRDAVHEQMRARFDAALELAEETTQRGLERLVGLGEGRLPPWTQEPELAVVNPSLHPRTDWVRFPFDPHPWAVPHPDPARGVHPALLHDLAGAAFTVDGEPARLVPARENGRLTLIPGRQGWDLEFVAREVPALGWKRVRVRRVEPGAGAAVAEPVEPGSAEARIAAADVSVALLPDGRFDLRFGERRYSGLGGVEDVGDRGDTYDFDPVTAGPGLALDAVRAWRTRHPSGIQTLVVERRLGVPAGLAPDRAERSAERVETRLRTELRVTPGVRRVDLRVRVEDPARDHRLRLLFPTGARAASFEAATTFDVACRTPLPRADAGWVQRAPTTFPHQGFVYAGGLTVAAPGLPEAEVSGDEEGTIAITLLRCVGHLSRHDLATRPGLAGPGTATPGAQCPEPLEAELALLPGLDPRAVRDAELGLRAVACGEAPLWPEGRSLLRLEPEALCATALKPAEEGRGAVLRVLNPTDEPLEARVTSDTGWTLGSPLRLDETPEAPTAAPDAAGGRGVPPHALRSFRLA